MISQTHYAMSDSIAPLNLRYAGLFFGHLLQMLACRVCQLNGVCMRACDAYSLLDIFDKLNSVMLV